MLTTNNKWTRLVTGAIKFVPEAQWVGVVVEVLAQLAVSMGATSGDSKEAHKHIDDLRSDVTRALDQATAANADLSQKLSAQLDTQATTFALHSEQLDAIGTQLDFIKIAIDTAADRLTQLEARSYRFFYLLAVLFLLSATTLVLIALLFLHLRSGR